MLKSERNAIFFHTSMWGSFMMAMFDVVAGMSKLSVIWVILAAVFAVLCILSCVSHE